MAQSDNSPKPINPSSSGEILNLANHVIESPIESKLSLKTLPGGIDPFENISLFYALFGAATCGDNQADLGDNGQKLQQQEQSSQELTADYVQRTSSYPNASEFHKLVGSSTCGGKEDLLRGATPEPTLEHPLFNEIDFLLRQL